MCLSYFELPQIVNLTYPNHDENFLLLDWTKIKQHTQSYYLPRVDYCDETTHTTIAKLIRELAHRNNSICRGDTGTSTSIYAPIQTFRDLGFNCTNLKEYNFTSINNCLASGNTVMASGITYTDNGNPVFGHSFIIDGIIYEKYWTGEYIREYGKDWELINDHGIQYRKLTHINWGWKGTYNGFFSEAPFYYSHSSEFDNPNDLYITESNNDCKFDKIYFFCIYK